MEVGKFLGKYTARGSIIGDTDGSPGLTKIHLFDGRFDTGWRVTRFEIRPQNVADDATSILHWAAKLTTVSFGGGVTRYDNWNFEDIREIAWAACSWDSNQASGLTTPFSLVDPDNLVIQDLYVAVNEYNDTNPVGYFIEMEKYEISEAMGALAMVRNDAQGPEAA